MSQSGELTFFTESPHSEPAKLIEQIAEIAKPRAITLVSRTYSESREWEEFLSTWDVPIPVVRRYEPEFELLDVTSVQQLADEYRDGRLLTAEFIHSAPADRIANSVAAAIPESVRGRYLPVDLFVHFGFHDIFDSVENEDGHLFGRAFLSLTFFGYGTPNDWEDFRRRVFEVPEVIAVRREFEVATGPLKQCICWSV